jgi:hypothetical protein
MERIERIERMDGMDGMDGMNGTAMGHGRSSFAGALQRTGGRKMDGKSFSATGELVVVIRRFVGRR